MYVPHYRKTIARPMMKDRTNDSTTLDGRVVAALTPTSNGLPPPPNPSGLALCWALEVRIEMIPLLTAVAEKPGADCVAVARDTEMDEVEVESEVDVIAVDVRSAV